MAQTQSSNPTPEQIAQQVIDDHRNAKKIALGPSPGAADAIKMATDITNHLIENYSGQRSPGPEDDPSGYLPVSLLAAGSIPTDPKKRIDTYAKAMFPDLYDRSPQFAQQKFGLKDGRPYWIPPGKTKMYWAAPASGQSISGTAKFMFPEFSRTTPGENLRDMASMPKDAAQNMGPAMSNIPGIVAGPAATASGLGALWSTGMAGAANMVGDAFRQALEPLVVPSTTLGPGGLDSSQLKGAALRGAAYQLGGVAIAKGGEFIAKSAPGVFKLERKYDVPYALELERKARAISDPKNPLFLTASETSNDAMVRTLTKAVMNQPTVTAKIETFFKGRNDQVGDAVDYLLNRIAPGLDDPMANAAMARNGASAVVKAKAQAIRDAAQKIYDISDAKAADMTPFYMNLQRAMTAPDQQISEASKKWIQNNIIPELGEPQWAIGPNMKAEPHYIISGKRLDDIKKKLDSNIKWDGQARDGFDSSVIDTLKKIRGNAASKPGDGTLLGEGDAQIPEWKAARAVYEQRLPEVQEAKNSRLGLLSKWEEKQGPFAAINLLFNPNSSSPSAVAFARDAFAKEGQGDAWNAYVRTYLEQSIDGLKTDSGGKVYNLGYNFRNKVFGSKKQQEILNEALQGQPDMQENLQWMMDVFDTMGRIPNQSFEAVASQATEEFKRQAAAQPEAWTPVLGPEFINSLAVWKAPGRFAKWREGIMHEKFAQKMASVLFEPGGVDKLRQMRALSPRSAAGIVGFTHLMGLANDIKPSEAERQAAERAMYPNQGPKVRLQLQR